MSRYKEFKEKCKEPVDINNCRDALQRLINREHTLHVPPKLDDEDILIMRALDELERLKSLITVDESQAYGNDCPKGVCD